MNINEEVKKWQNLDNHLQTSVSKHSFRSRTCSFLFKCMHIQPQIIFSCICTSCSTFGNEMQGYLQTYHFWELLDDYLHLKENTVSTLYLLVMLMHKIYQSNSILIRVIIQNSIDLFCLMNINEYMKTGVKHSSLHRIDVKHHLSALNKLPSTYKWLIWSV